VILFVSHQDGQLSFIVDDLVSLVKFISLNNRFYQANFFDLDLKEVA
jgi:hypothetical protein